MKFDFKGFATNLSRACEKNAPELLFGLGIAGIFVTIGTTIVATKKAVRAVDQEETKPKPKVVAKKVWKYYIPPAISTGMTLVCLFGSNSAHLKRNAALAAAYTLSETALREYQDKVVETIGEKKELSIRDAIAKDKVENTPFVSKEIFISEKGEVRFLEPITKRRFLSTVEKVRKAEIDLNRRLLYEQYVSLNDFFYLVHLEEAEVGDMLGWNVDKGLLEIRFSAQADQDDVPCLVIEYVNPPRYEYS